MIVSKLRNIKLYILAVAYTYIGADVSVHDVSKLYNIAIVLYVYITAVYSIYTIAVAYTYTALMNIMMINFCIDFAACRLIISVVGRETGKVRNDRPY